MRTAAFLFIFALSGMAGSAKAEPRDISREIDSLVTLCKSTTSADIRGELEGGLKQLFGNVVEAKGDISIKDSEYSFLQLFETDEARLEAQKVFNDCAINGIRIIYGLRQEAEKMASR
ncbi:hypothetical protein [Oharaeibacter diazotrophicus]|uniref:hypothetical protein n=1 Tax=Oharaeibacter diazotrophicus TaxID=1920512 RepID=UPI000F82880D|nr:hypothetical protein [Oharaeibacter diazotrophicus]GLS78661.1 hypothetical protein GCM10007904_39980 [Oharaeibacter diazotrophicus]